MEIGWKVAAKALFGRALRVALADWIVRREGAPFFQTEAQDAMRRLGEASSGVSKELTVFVQHGMLTTFVDDRRLYYTPTDSAMWAVFAAAAAGLGVPAESGENSTSPAKAGS